MVPIRQFARSLRTTLFGAPNESLETCLLFPKSKVVYAYIPKAACTAIKTWIVRYSGECPELAPPFDQAEKTGCEPPEVHDLLRDRYSLKRWSAATLRGALADPSYFKFAYVRHPFRRIVSAYLDKVVHARSPAHELIRSGQRTAGCLAGGNLAWRAPRIDAERSLSFREFIQALETADPERLDHHFRTQDLLLRGLRFDFIGQVEKLPQDFSVVQERLKIAEPLTWRHIRVYSLPVSECVADWPAARFRAGPTPLWTQFFDAALQRTCSKLYAADFQRFGYSPEAEA
jgi:hypothetical protein